MSDKISPPVKSVGKSGGFSQPSHSTITTPKDNECRAWTKGEAKGSIMGKK